MHKRKLTATVCLAALLLTGCGDDGSRSAPTPNVASYPAPAGSLTEPVSGYPASVVETAAPPTSYPAPAP